MFLQLNKILKKHKFTMTSLDLTKFKKAFQAIF